MAQKDRYHIPTRLYKKILEVIPVLTVDLIIVHRGKLLLLKRSIAPAKGQWWSPGGRVLKGEKLEVAAKRKAKEETGFNVRIVRLLGADGVYWRKNRWGTSSHTPSVVYLARPSSKKTRIKLNFNNNEARWFKKIPKGLHPFVRKFARLAGFK